MVISSSSGKSKVANNSWTKAIGGDRSIPQSAPGSLTNAICSTAMTVAKPFPLTCCVLVARVVLVECGSCLVVSVSSRKRSGQRE